MKKALRLGMLATGSSPRLEKNEKGGKNNELFSAKMPMLAKRG